MHCKSSKRARKPQHTFGKSLPSQGINVKCLILAVLPTTHYPLTYFLAFSFKPLLFFQKTADWHTTWTVGAISVYCGHYANLKYALMPAWCTKLCSTQERILHRIPYPINAMWSIIKYISGYPLFKWPWFWRYFFHKFFPYGSLRWSIISHEPNQPATRWIITLNFVLKQKTYLKIGQKYNGTTLFTE